jgi:flagellar hook-length control protein FliK
MQPAETDDQGAVEAAPQAAVGAAGAPAIQDIPGSAPAQAVTSQPGSGAAVATANTMANAPAAPAATDAATAVSVAASQRATTDAPAAAAPANTRNGKGVDAPQAESTPRVDTSAGPVGDDATTASVTDTDGATSRLAESEVAMAEPRHVSTRSVRGGAHTAAARFQAMQALASKEVSASSGNPSSAVPVVANVAVSTGAAVVQTTVPADVAAKASTRETTGATVQIQATAGIQAGFEAPMTGGEQSSQGDGRRSADFMRFAAALSQVASASSDEGHASVAQLVTRAVESAPAVMPTPSIAATVGTAPAAAVTQLSADTMPEAENIGRLVQAMRINARPGAWEATVRLKPEHLGDVTIALKVEGNSVSAVVNAEAAGVRQWLESHEQAVRNGMAEHGLQLERFIVQRDGQRRGDGQPSDQEPQRRRARRQPAAAERFEIVV